MICPCCGYDSNDKRNYQKKIDDLLKLRDSKSKNYLIYVLKIINKFEPLSKKDLYFFLQSISKVDDFSLYSAVKSYDLSNPYDSYKGINYLKAIILSYDNIYKKNQQQIINRIGARAKELPDEYKTEEK